MTRRRLKREPTRGRERERMKERDRKRDRQTDREREKREENERRRKKAYSALNMQFAEIGKLREEDIIKIGFLNHWEVESIERQI